MEILPDVPMDWSPSIEPQFDIDEVGFGDGYRQRRPGGINSIRDRASVSWSLLSRDEFDLLYLFLRPRKGISAFYWAPPGEYAMRRWVCKELSHAKTSAIYWSISATFEETFE